LFPRDLNAVRLLKLAEAANVLSEGYRVLHPVTTRERVEAQPKPGFRLVDSDLVRRRIRMHNRRIAWIDLPHIPAKRFLLLAKLNSATLASFR
jgi:hypothetical protein